MKYQKRSKLEKLPIEEVVARLEAASIPLPSWRIFEDDIDPQFETIETFRSPESQRQHYAKLFPIVCRDRLFAHGVSAYCARIGMTELDKLLAENNLSTAWSTRTGIRSAKEKTLAAHLCSKEEK